MGVWLESVNGLQMEVLIQPYQRRKMDGRQQQVNKLQRMADDILERGDCFTIKDLDITGVDLIEYGLKRCV